MDIILMVDFETLLCDNEWSSKQKQLPRILKIQTTLLTS